MMTKDEQKKIKKDILYNETQRLPYFWYIISFSLLFIIIGYFFLGEYFLKNNWLYNSISSETRGIILIITVVFTINILFSHLKITVSQTGLHINYWPLVNRQIDFSDIEKVEVIRYKPMIDFGTWGRRSSQDRDITFNVNGTQGIRLLLKNGRTLIVGSQMVSELTNAINSAVEAKEKDKQFPLDDVFVAV